MAVAFDQFETIIRENLGNAVINLDMSEVDDPALRMIDTFEPLGKGGIPATSSDNVWEARRKLKLSRGGMITGGTFGGNTLTMMGTSDILPVGQLASAVAPDPEKVPLTQYQTIYTQLKRILGNVTVNMTQILADLIGDDIEEVAVGHVEDAVFQVRKNLAAWFYADGTGSLAQCSAESPTAISAEGTPVAVAIKTGTYNRFIKGQRYVFGDDSATWPTTKTQLGGICRCTHIDDVNEQPYFELEAGEAAVTLATDDHICLEGSIDWTNNSTYGVPEGIEKFFKETDTSWFGLNIATYPELKSRVEGSETFLVDPEPEIFAKLYDEIADAGKAPPTLFVSERAVQTQYALLEKKGFAVYNIPGVMPTANGGVTGAIFQHGTIVVPWEVSAYIRPGSVWGAAPDTIHKFQPGGANTIRWWNARGSGSGISGIFVPVADGTQQTELWQAPFETHIGFLPVDPKRNFRRIGLTTQKTA